MNFQNDFGLNPKDSPNDIEGKMFKYDIGTSLMSRVAKVASTPLHLIDAEGFRLLLVQKMFLKSIVPGAIVLLNYAPFVGGDSEEGALMRSLFEFVPITFWHENLDIFTKAKSVLVTGQQQLNAALANESDSDALSLLQEAGESFAKAQNSVQSIEQQLKYDF